MGRVIDNGVWTPEDPFVVRVIDSQYVQIRDDGRKICIPGIKQWCLRHGVDYQEFRKHGIPAQRIVDTGDVRAQLALLKYYRLRRNNGR